MLLTNPRLLNPPWVLPRALDDADGLPENDLNRVVTEFYGMIAKWAIDKGWHKVQSPRCPLQLLALAGTEIAELEDALLALGGSTTLDGRAAAEANLQEEVAGFWVRCIQLKSELDISHEFDGEALIDCWEHTPYWAVNCAIEAYRKDGYATRHHQLWQCLCTAMIQTRHILRTVFSDRPEITMSYVIEVEMAKNQKRPIRHGKHA
jgi:hypothetical protein